MAAGFVMAWLGGLAAIIGITNTDAAINHKSGKEPEKRPKDWMNDWDE